MILESLATQDHLYRWIREESTYCKTLRQLISRPGSLVFRRNFRSLLLSRKIQFSRRSFAEGTRDIENWE